VHAAMTTVRGFVSELSLIDLLSFTHTHTLSLSLSISPYSAVAFPAHSLFSSPSPSWPSSRVPASAIRSPFALTPRSRSPNCCACSCLLAAQVSVSGQMAEKPRKCNQVFTCLPTNHSISTKQNERKNQKQNSGENRVFAHSSLSFLRIPCRPTQPAHIHLVPPPPQKRRSAR
jgi:hypothetical protein